MEVNQQPAVNKSSLKSNHTKNKQRQKNLILCLDKVFSFSTVAVDSIVTGLDKDSTDNVPS